MVVSSSIPVNNVRTLNAAPTEPMNPQQKREAEMRAAYDKEQADKQAKANSYQSEFEDNLTRTRLRSGM